MPYIRGRAAGKTAAPAGGCVGTVIPLEIYIHLGLHAALAVNDDYGFG